MAENKKSNQADAYMESMKAYQKTCLLYTSDAADE